MQFDKILITIHLQKFDNCRKCHSGPGCQFNSGCQGTKNCRHMHSWKHRKKSTGAERICYSTRIIEIIDFHLKDLNI